MRRRLLTFDPSPMMVVSFFRQKAYAMSRTLHPLFTALLVMVAIGLAAAFPFRATADEGFSAKQKSAIDAMIQDYIMKNPQVILDAVQQHQEREAAAEQARQQAQLHVMKEQIKQSKTSPVGGNPEGDVTIVEFFDYNCGYCKRVHGTVADVLEKDGKVRLVYKELPILGPQSLLAARAALGVFYSAPKKYTEFHDLLMTSRGGLEEQKIMDLAEMAGLKAAAVKKAMDDPRVDQEIQHNLALAQQLGINGTPAFIIGDTLVPGAIDAQTLSKLISESRGS
tara:strand:- start:7541 stop:8383 length:843 start_codon:yes stop_codon:yes gene_type:complete